MGEEGEVEDQVSSQSQQLHDSLFLTPSFLPLPFPLLLSPPLINMYTNTCSGIHEYIRSWHHTRPPSRTFLSLLPYPPRLAFSPFTLLSPSPSPLHPPSCPSLSCTHICLADSHFFLPLPLFPPLQASLLPSPLISP